MRELNEFSGMWTTQLEARLRSLNERHDAMRKAVDDGEELGGGSPFEGVYEEMAALEAELKRRALASQQ